MRKTLKVVAFGGDPADAFLKAAGITDATITSAVKTLVRGLQADGLWSKMLGIYPLVGGTASSHAWNLRDTTKLKIRWVGGMTHDSTGATGNGINSYGQPDVVGTTGINAINSSPLAATNYGIGVYIRTRTSEYAPQAGFGYSGGNFRANQGDTGWVKYEGILANGNGLDALASVKTGFFHMYGGSGTGSGLANGTKIATGTGGVLSNPAQNTYLWLGGSNGVGISNRNFAFFTVSQYLSDTEASNLYTRIQTFQTSLNRYVGVPIYPSFDSDAQSFMTSASITDSTQQAAVNYLVTDLKSNNLWTKMKAVYPMVGGTASSHSYNLKNPAQYQITWNGGWTHSSTGATPNGTNAYANTNLVPSTNLSLNNYHLSFYSRTQNTSLNGNDMGAALTYGGHGLTFYYASIAKKFFATGSYPTYYIQVSDTTTTGLLIGNRQSASSAKLILNTSTLGTLSVSDNTLSTVAMYLGANNNSGTAVDFQNRQCAFSTIGDGLTDTDASNLYTIVQNYQTILSRNI